MHTIRIVSNLDECRDLWQQLMPQELVSDLWEVRDCFQRHYRHQPHFVVAEDRGRVKGLLPLSWNREIRQFGYFPGETWEGKTWLEQNRIIASDRRMLGDMLRSLDKPYHLRYLRTDDRWGGAEDNVDELGYLFFPPDYGYDVQRYFEAFSHKTAKRLTRELNGWNTRRPEWRFGQPDDFTLLVQMNRKRYGELSYFSDHRFLDSFRSLVDLLHDRGWLRMVTVIVDGEPAAVDMGSLYGGMLTLLAGGTNEKFPGIAKLINMQHIKYACETRLESVDFLCGDFNWKARFHLTPNPLYVLEGDGHPAPAPAVQPSSHIHLSPGFQDAHGVSHA